MIKGVNRRGWKSFCGTNIKIIPIKGFYSECSIWFDFYSKAVIYLSKQQISFKTQFFFLVFFFLNSLLPEYSSIERFSFSRFPLVLYSSYTFHGQTFNKHSAPPSPCALPPHVLLIYNPSILSFALVSTHLPGSLSVLNQLQDICLETEAGFVI